MDINELRVAITIISFVTFIAIVFWAYSGRRKQGFDRAARSVLEERDDAHHSNARR